MKKSKGFKGMLATAGKRVLTGENLFTATFTNTSIDKKVVAFAAPYPGTIIPIDLNAIGGQIIVQRDGFLCAALGTRLSMHFNQKLGSGLFGGEGFILQKLRSEERRVGKECRL